MKNDEKVDINLSGNVAEDQLSQEELFKLNYDTAMRYVNIAEHMKKYEDQEKYYHRAINYLEKINDDKKFTSKIKELKRKKFTARVDGKIAMYEEASSIRDRAKTPQDYYSAQAIFHRIAAYEPKHPIREKWITPEKYQRSLSCVDSAEQEIICGQKAVETEVAQRRQSLFASISLIILIIAFVLFARTTMFRRVLASGYELIHYHVGAYQKYNAIYERTGEKAAYEKYIFHRYKAGESALKSGDKDSAYDDFKACAEDNYKDSQAQLTKLEIERIKSEAALGEIIHFARMDWRVLAIEDDRIFVSKDKSLGSTAFNDHTGACTWADSSVRAWLNGEFMDENFYDDEKNAVIDTTVETTSNPDYPSVSTGAATTDKLFLMSIDEVKKYNDQLHTTETWWWLRTPGAYAGSMAFVNRDKQVMTYGYDVTSTDITVKPAMWISLK